MISSFFSLTARDDDLTCVLQDEWPGQRCAGRETAGPPKYTDLGLEKSTFKRWADFHVFSALKCCTDMILPDKEN